MNKDVILETINKKISEVTNEELVQLLEEEVTFTNTENVITSEYHIVKAEIISRMSAKN